VSEEAPKASLGRRRVLALLLLVPLVVATAAWAITYTPLFQARHIRVEGAVSLRPDAVRSLAGIAPSTNVFHLQTEAVAASLLQDPWIASASVQRDLPDTIVLSIVEREPVGMIDVTGEPSILASDGTILPASTATTSAVHELPKVQAALGSPDETQRAAAAALLAALDPVVAHRVSEVSVGQDLHTSLTLRDGVTVDAGTPGDETQKAVALRAVFRWAASGRYSLASIDVSAPDAPSATLANGSTLTP
jgi:cell division protein FtsQ